MFEKSVRFSDEGAPMSVDRAVTPESCSDSASNGQQHKVKARQSAIRLIVALEQAAASQLPPARRILLLKELEPKVIKLTARIPKPVVSARQLAAKEAIGQTLEQRLYSLMARSLKLTLEEVDCSDAAYSTTSAGLRLWTIKGLFLFLGRQIEYAVRWDRPYPPNTWAMLHGLYLYLSARTDIRLGFSSAGGDDSFKPEEEYMRVLLLGLVRQLLPPADRSPLLYGALASLARQSRLEDPASYGGAFDLYVVEIARDTPPRSSGVLDDGFNGWVLEPAPELIDLIAEMRG